MFAKLACLVLAVPLVSALTLSTPTGVTAGGSLTIGWTATTTDPPYFSIELVNAAFNKEYAVANNVQTSLGEITITLPQVNFGDGYSLNAIAINNVNQVLSSSGDFSIGAETTSATSAGSTSASASSATPSTASASASASAASLTTPSSSAASRTAVSTGSSSSSTATATPSAFNHNGAGALQMPSMMPAAALVLSAVAGAAMVF